MKMIAFQCHFVFYYSSNQYLLSVHHVHDKIYSREVTNIEYMTTAHEELTI